MSLPPLEVPRAAVFGLSRPLHTHRQQSPSTLPHTREVT